MTADILKQSDADLHCAETEIVFGPEVKSISKQVSSTDENGDNQVSFSIEFNQGES